MTQFERIVERSMWNGRQAGSRRQLRFARATIDSSSLVYFLVRGSACCRPVKGTRVWLGRCCLRAAFSWGDCCLSLTLLMASGMGDLVGCVARNCRAINTASSGRSPCLLACPKSLEISAGAGNAVLVLLRTVRSVAV